MIAAAQGIATISRTETHRLGFGASPVTKEALLSYLLTSFVQKPEYCLQLRRTEPHNNPLVEQYSRFVPTHSAELDCENPRLSPGWGLV